MRLKQLHNFAVLQFRSSAILQFRNFAIPQFCNFAIPQHSPDCNSGKLKISPPTLKGVELATMFIQKHNPIIKWSEFHLLISIE